MVAPAHPARRTHGLCGGGAAILIKNSLALLTMLVLAGTTPFRKLLAACGSWACRPCSSPRSSSWTDIAMSCSTSSTGWPRRGGRAPSTAATRWPGACSPGLIGMLFLRTFERAERVHGAMVARGWDGTIRSLDD